MTEGGTKRYRTIVVDPPWPIGRTGLGFGRNGNSKRWEPGELRVTSLPYQSMTVDEIASLPVREVSEPAGAHLYVWTTQRFLRETFDIAVGWGFSVSSTLVWCKEPRGFNMGGTFASTTEFILFCRRGSLRANERVQRQWFTWPRLGASAKYGESQQRTHSAKPEAFLDMVESVSPGPYCELFARRDRLGWDTWGNESLNTASMVA